MRKFLDLTGERFGAMTVVKRAPNKHGTIVWECLCDCGNTCEQYGSNLKKGWGRSCGCLRSINMVGLRFGKLVVLEKERVNKHGGSIWKCRCDCGEICYHDGGNLRRGYSKSCGCLNYVNIKGERYGRLTVIEKSPEKTNNAGLKWVCRCDCAAMVTVTSNALRQGLTKSCGCLMRDKAIERFTTHGMSRSPVYRVWNAMCTRCNDLDNGGHPRYGGRGIKVCDRWRKSFVDFYDDMGPRPPGGTIDRIDNDGDYEPGNCRWASRYVQSANQGISSLNTTGTTGVSKLKRGNYLAELAVYGKKVLKKEFPTLEEAVEARQNAEKEFRKDLI